MRTYFYSYEVIDAATMLVLNKGCGTFSATTTPTAKDTREMLIKLVEESRNTTIDGQTKELVITALNPL